MTRIDLTATPGTERAVKGAAASLIDLGGPHSPVFHTLHARGPHAGQTAYEIDAEELDAVVPGFVNPVFSWPILRGESLAPGPVSPQPGGTGSGTWHATAALES
ncbi:hypothetical protein, partial [Actinoplanes campanulatus]